MQSFAAGLKTKAAGAASVALGTGVTAQGDGSFAFGDRNIDFQHTPGPNEFWVRAFGGIGLNTGVGIGCDLPPNTGAWACTSSKLLNEGFEAAEDRTDLGGVVGATVGVRLGRMLSFYVAAEDSIYGTRLDGTTLGEESRTQNDVKIAVGFGFPVGR